MHYDLCVIGTGPGGEGAAMQAVKSGKNVIVVERHEMIGGGCTHYGTIPSKALRFSIFRVAELAAGNPFQDPNSLSQRPFREYRSSAATIIAKQETMRRGFYSRNRVPIASGHARFVDPRTIEVDGQTTITAEAFVIATGSRPDHPPDVDFTHPLIMDSDSILSMADTPQSITIYGAGVVGCEYASMLKNLGCKINLVNTRQQLLDFLDDEIVDALSYHMRDRGIVIRHREEYESIQGGEDGVVVHLKSGKQIKSDVLLWANGRTGNTEDLGLENIGLVPDRRGYLQVNDAFQTAVPTIYAVGDIVGFPSLASAAYMQGRAAAVHFVSGATETLDLTDIPTGIYTSPEISSIGKTERDLTEQKIPYEVGQAQFKSLARAQITGRPTGLLKILFHRETLQLLGIHCFGPNASEIIHIGQAIMSQPGEGNSLMYFINTTFNYPTMAEAYRVAALNGHNRLF